MEGSRKLLECSPFLPFPICRLVKSGPVPGKFEARSWLLWNMRAHAKQVLNCPAILLTPRLFTAIRTFCSMTRTEQPIGNFTPKHIYIFIYIYIFIILYFLSQELNPSGNSRPNTHWYLIQTNNLTNHEIFYYVNLRKLEHTPQTKQERSILLQRKKINIFQPSF